MDPILLELMTLCKINSEAEAEVFKSLQELKEQEDQLQNCHKEIDLSRAHLLQDEYVSAMIVKNIEQSFQ